MRSWPTSRFWWTPGASARARNLVGMLDAAGISIQDFEFVLISHSHEDHDGGLAELVEMTDLKVKAHAIYDLLIRRYPEDAPTGYKANFPAKCWHCPMPESFWSKNCLGYHRVLTDLEIEKIGGGENIFWRRHPLISSAGPQSGLFGGYAG